MNKSHDNPVPIPPLSLVRIARATSRQPAWGNQLGRVFRVGYYRPSDGLDCVWLVDDAGNYVETVDQAMIRTHFTIEHLSDERDLFGEHRPQIGHRVAGSERA
jgi:hypothetical protein